MKRTSSLVLFRSLQFAAVLCAGLSVKASSFGMFSADSSRWVYGAAYWNDDIGFDTPLNRLAGRTLFPGTDDKLTANFWFYFGCWDKFPVWKIESVYRIVTSRSDGYRTDVVTFDGWIGMPGIWGNGEAGAEIGAYGSFGGGSLQNWYHRTAGFPELQLPYHTGQRVWVSLLARWNRELPLATWCAAIPSLRGAISAGKGPKAFRGIVWLTAWSGGNRRLTLAAGWGYHASAAAIPPLSPSAGTGTLIDLVVSLRIVNRTRMSFGILKNHYGNNQRHYALILGIDEFGSTALMTP